MGPGVRPRLVVADADDGRRRCRSAVVGEHALEGPAATGLASTKNQGVPSGFRTTIMPAGTTGAGAAASIGTGKA